jgi:hypothetical protein
MRLVTEVCSPRGYFIHINYNSGGGGGGGDDDDGMIMPTMTTLTARIQLLKLCLVHYESQIYAKVYYLI